MGDNRPEWVIADLAIQAIGAITVGVPPDAPSTELRAVMDQCGACAVIAEDETTTIITSGFVAVLDPSGAIRLTAKSIAGKSIAGK